MTLQEKLLAWYACHGRTSLPWRTTRNPYFSVVSEFMLQQTQVDRVVPAFERFVARFPNFAALARGNRADVVRAWQGLGYNSRAVRLHELARAVVERYGGALPREDAELRALPGVGPYTAAAIRAFAFDITDAPADTNVRRIVHRLFWGAEYPPKAAQAMLDERARQLVPHGRAHDWSSALMDLGASLCTARAPTCLLCPLQDECAAAPIDAAALESARRQCGRAASGEGALPFEQTRRFVRGRIVDRLRSLPPGQAISLLDLHRDLEPALPGRGLEEIEAIARALVRDGIVRASDGAFALCD